MGSVNGSSVTPRVAVVTGSNRGLGLAIGRALARTGDHVVVVTGRSEQDAQSAAARLRLDTEVMAHTLDVTDPASVCQLFADVERNYGRLDALVNNAGIAIDWHLRATTIDMETARATLETNLFGAWRCAQAAIALMRVHDYGRIVNVTSCLGSLERMEADCPAYRISKAALNALTRILAAETEDENIKVNAASPGSGVDTRMTRGTPALSADQAADSLLWLTCCPPDGPTGGFFLGREQLPW
ncbi:SDR family NAD(P)-dependent oxidoreductase [Streptomyces marianii]|uniref:SDR family NAD(P)-dependent oxidoreductase n=2 Tax=Streptomyces marianii TaxID=1817406 RepID=A0A5R9ECZ6_9ACTN|nr:SDR family NAD(P)-dependent oxidoreductase [Streptomyces marianii]